MTDKIIKREHVLCECCMEEHEVLTVETLENNIFMGVEVEYTAIYKYCDKADEYFESQYSLCGCSLSTHACERYGIPDCKNRNCRSYP